MQVHRALRLAGRARGIEPETDVVGTGRRRLEAVRLVGQRVGQTLVAVVAVLAAGDDDRPEEGVGVQMTLELGQQVGADDERPRTAVVQHEGVVVGRQAGVHRDRHDPGLDRAEEHGGEVDGVGHRHQHPLLHPQAAGDEQIGDLVGPPVEVGVAVGAGGVDEGRLVAAAGREIAADQILGRVVMLEQGRIPRHRFSSLGSAVSSRRSPLFVFSGVPCAGFLACPVRPSGRSRPRCQRVKSIAPSGSR